VKVHGVSFKKRAPRAIKEIKAFAEQAMVRTHHNYLFNRTSMAPDNWVEDQRANIAI
jgi:hypothetical protein